LGERLKDLRHQEEQARRRADYDAAAAEKLAELMARIAANDGIIERINRKGLPQDAKWVPGVSGGARAAELQCRRKLRAAAHRGAAAASVRVLGAGALCVATRTKIVAKSDVTHEADIMRTRQNRRE